MRAAVALIFVLVASACATSLWQRSKCGDGVVSGTEKCDNGLRYIEQTNTLPWVGSGPSQPSLEKTVSFKYRARDLFVAGVWFPVYELSIPATTSYGARCDTLLNNGLPYAVMVQMAPYPAIFESTLQSSKIQWIYAPPRGQTISCAAFFTMGCGGDTEGDDWPLIAFNFTWIGAQSKLVWREAFTSRAPQCHKMQPNDLCGSECCTSTCQLTNNAKAGGSCSNSQPTAYPPIVGNFFCSKINGTCMGTAVSQSRTPSPSVIPVNDDAATCGNGLVVSPETCDPGIRCVHITNIVLGQYSVDVSFSYIPKTTQMFNYKVLLTDINTLAVTNVNVANQAYTWNCDPGILGILGIKLGTKPASLVTYPYFFIEWSYTLSLGTCASYDPDFSGGTILGTLRMKYMPSAGVTLDQTYLAVLANQIQPNTYCGTTCCSSTCQIIGGATGTSCPDMTPLNPFGTPTYKCNSAGVCSVAPTPSVTPTRTPSISTTGTRTATPTVSTTGTTTATPTSSPTPSISLTNTATGTSTATPTPTPSNTNTGTATGTTTATPSTTPSASNTPLTCGDGILTPPEQCDQGFFCVNTTRTLNDGTAIRVSFQVNTRVGQVYNYQVFDVTVPATPVEIVIANKFELAYRCHESSATNTLSLSVSPPLVDPLTTSLPTYVQPTAFPAFTFVMRYAFLAGSPLTCAGYNLQHVGFVRGGSFTGTRYYPTGLSGPFDTSSFAVGTDPVLPITQCGTPCCTNVCVITPTSDGLSCPQMPAANASTAPQYVCFNGICGNFAPSVSRTPSTTTTGTTTATPTPTNTGTATGTTTATPTPTPSTTGTTTATPTPSTTTTGTTTSTPTPSITPTPSNTPSSSQTPSNIPASCGDGSIDPGEQCDQGFYCINKIGMPVGPSTLDIAFQYIPRQSGLYRLIVYYNNTPVSLSTVPSYTFMCEMNLLGTLMTLGATTTPTGYPAVTITWTFVVIPGLVTCSNYDINLNGLTVSTMNVRYYVAPGTTYSLDSIDLLTNGMTPNVPCSSACCDWMCAIVSGSDGIPCPDQTPLSLGPNASYICSGGICGMFTPSVTRTPSTTTTGTGTTTGSNTPSASPTPSTTTTSTGTSTGSNTPSTTGTATGSNSPTPSTTTTGTGTATGSDSPTPSGTPSTTATMSPGVSMSNTPSETPSSSVSATPSSSTSTTASATSTPTPSTSESESPTSSNTPTPTNGPTFTGSSPLTATATATATPTPSESTTSSPTASTSPSTGSSPSTPPTNDDTGPIIGGTIGGVTVIALVALCAACTWFALGAWRRRRPVDMDSVPFTAVSSNDQGQRTRMSGVVLVGPPDDDLL